MVLMQFTFYIDKGKGKEYRKWLDEVGLPYWHTVPGAKVIRSYSELGSGRVLSEIEFESFEAWGKAFDNPKMKEINNEFASYTHGMKWNLWDKSQRFPDPIKLGK